METYALRYFVLNKPFGMLSQFVSPHKAPLLGDLGYSFPEGIHAIGRLDKESEGLLLLSTDKRITALLFQGTVPHRRTYLVQVKHLVNEERLQQLRTGITIRIKTGTYYTTPPCEVDIVDPPPGLFPLPYPQYEYHPTTWLQITLTEGRYHQVRKMVAAVRHRCRRLIRTSIEDLELGDLQPGEVREVSQEVFFKKLKLDMPLAPYEDTRGWTDPEQQ